MQLLLWTVIIGMVVAAVIIMAAKFSDDSDFSQPGQASGSGSAPASQSVKVTTHQTVDARKETEALLNAIANAGKTLGFHCFLSVETVAEFCYFTL